MIFTKKINYVKKRSWGVFLFAFSTESSDGKHLLIVMFFDVFYSAESEPNGFISGDTYPRQYLKVQISNMAQCNVLKHLF